jgi:hypothetical protein
MRCRVLRAGFETPSGEQADGGQIVRLPGRIAELAAGNGAIEILAETGAAS